MPSSKLKADLIRAEKEKAYEKFLNGFKKSKYSCLNCVKCYDCEKWTKLRHIVSSKPAKQLRIGESAKKRRSELRTWEIERAKAFSKVRRCINVRRKLQRRGYKMFTIK